MQSCSCNVSEFKEFRQEMRSNFENLFEAIRQLSLQNAGKHSTSIENNPAIMLPALPFTCFGDLNTFNVRLLDTPFMDQMVCNKIKDLSK